MSKLQIPVVSWKPGLVAAVERRVLADAASPARTLLERGELEFVLVPVPEFPSEENGETRWELTEQQEAVLANARIVIGDAHNCASLLLSPATGLPQDKQHLLKNVQWVQGTYAGVEKFLQLLAPDQPEPPFDLTRAGGSDGMAQYVLGWIITLERKLHLAAQLQADKVYGHDELKYRSFQSLTVGILGLGAIGQTIGRLVKLAGFRVVGFKRQLHGDEATVFQDCTHRVTDSLEDVLQSSDFIVSILPSTAATKFLLNERNLPLCRAKKPVLINVGRGDVISEDAIVTALDSQWLSTAVLDVFECEPLDASSRLWHHPGVKLTPHVAAFCFVEDVADVFVPNLNAFLQQQPLPHMRVNWATGY